MAPALHGDSRLALLLFFAGRRNMAARRASPPGAFLSPSPSVLPLRRPRGARDSSSIHSRFYAEVAFRSFVLRGCVFMSCMLLGQRLVDLTRDARFSVKFRIRKQRYITYLYRIITDSFFCRQNSYRKDFFFLFLCLMST